MHPSLDKMQEVGRACGCLADTWIDDVVVVVQSLTHVRLFVTSCTAACQASLSFTISWSLLKLTSTRDDLPMQNDGTRASQVERRHEQVPRLLGNRAEGVLLKSSGQWGKGKSRRSQASQGSRAHSGAFIWREMQDQWRECLMQSEEERIKTGGDGAWTKKGTVDRERSRWVWVLREQSIFDKRGNRKGLA